MQWFTGRIFHSVFLNRSSVHLLLASVAVRSSFQQVFSNFHSFVIKNLTSSPNWRVVMPLPLAHPGPVSFAVSSVCNLSGCWMNEQRWRLRSRPSSLGLLPCRSQRSGRTPETRRIFHQRIHFCPHFLLILPSYLMIRIRWEMVGAGGLARL